MGEGREVSFIKKNLLVLIGWSHLSALAQAEERELERWLNMEHQLYVICKKRKVEPPTAEGDHLGITQTVTGQ